MFASSANYRLTSIDSRQEDRPDSGLPDERGQAATAVLQQDCTAPAGLEPLVAAVAQRLVLAQRAAATVDECQVTWRS